VRRDSAANLLGGAFVRQYRLVQRCSVCVQRCFVVCVQRRFVGSVERFSVIRVERRLFFCLQRRIFVPVE
jgi:hypothetical protein